MVRGVTTCRRSIVEISAPLTGKFLAFPLRSSKKIDDTYWVTTKKYPNKATSQHQLADACVDEFGPDALPLLIEHDDHGNIKDKKLDLEEAEILTYFWGMDTSCLSCDANVKADQMVLLNANGANAFYGEFNAGDNKPLAVMAHKPSDDVCKKHPSDSFGCETGLRFQYAPSLPYLRVGCMLKAPPADAEAKEQAALGNTPAVTVDKYPAPTAAPTGAPTDSPTKNAPAPAPGTLGAAAPGGPASGPGSATTPQAAPGPSPAASSPASGPGSDTTPQAVPGPSPAASSPAKKVATKTASSSGDPHFLTWSGDKFDFHGGCDLVLLQNKGFANDLGLDIHIRTHIQTWWSHISQAAIRIGPDTLEVMGGSNDGGTYLINGKPGKPLESGAKLSISGYTVVFQSISLKQNRFRIDLGNGNAISIETYKEFVRVNVKAMNDTDFVGATGLMGFYPSGEILARDGLTAMQDPEMFGKEWQVLVSEPMLFHRVEGPQHPQVCAMPDETATKTKKRRLGEALITEKEAEIACAHANMEEKDACIFDVLATQDKDLAGSY